MAPALAYNDRTILRLNTSEPQLGEFCRQRHIHRLALFGSTQAGTARPDNDIDLLVEFEPGLLGLAAMEAELTRLLSGKKLDLRTAQDLISENGGSPLYE